jgi:hypothetical protein
MYKPRNRREPPALKVVAEEAYKEFKIAEKRMEDLRKAWMHAHANYEFTVNGVEDCLERVLRKYPNKIESIDFLEEIDTYRRLSDSRKTLVENKIFMQRMVDALQKFKEIKRLLTEERDANKLNTMIFMLEEAINIEYEFPLKGDDVKNRYLNNAINVKFGIRLHIDAYNTTGFRNNVLNVVVLGVNLYKKLYPRGGRLSPKRLLEFKDFMRNANDRSGCIDFRIDELSSFVFKGDYAVDINAPFITNLCYIVTRKLREKCKKEGLQKVRSDIFIHQMSRDRDFIQFILSFMRRRPGVIEQELRDAGINLTFRSFYVFREWEKILFQLFKYLSDLGIIEILDGFLDCPPPVQDQQQQG